MSEAPQIYSAAQIARALRKSRQAVQRLLAPSQPDGKTLVRGNETNAWSFSRMPAYLQTLLTTEATRLGYLNAEALLSSEPTIWTPPIALKDVEQKFIDRAFKLRTALALPLEKQHTVSPGELTQLGLSEFQKAFGYAISEKQWKRLFDRTAQRDGGCENFQRVEIYLDESAFQRTAPKREVATKLFLHRSLDEIIANLVNKAAPTAEDREWIFDSAFRHFEKLLSEAAERREQKSIKKSLVSYLFEALPGLSKTETALRRVFEINLQKWRVNDRRPSALMDLRRLKSGNFRTPDFSEDKKKITEKAILHGGNETLAYRMLRQAGELSPEFIEHFHFDARRNKSYLPKTVRDEITPHVEMCGPIHRGPWEAKMRGPYIPRDWSAVSPGQFFSGDDVTFNSYTWTELESGELWIGRPECLIINDLRTGYCLNHLGIAGKYNGRHIKSLIRKVHDDHGLPDDGFYFENSVWKSRWVKDLERPKFSLHWRETENALRASGVNVEVRHAKTPRAKPIEGLFRIFQERQRCWPGFAGFNERTKEMERVQEFIARARRGKEHPGNELMEMQEWSNQISRTIEEFNSDPQNGKMLPGISPLEGWRQRLESKPLRQLPEECRFMLSTHKEPVTVRQEGIILNIGRERMLYANEETGKLIGRKVLAFYNVDNPELLTVSDLNRQNYFTVKRIQLPAMSASKDQFAQVHSQIAGHTKAARTIYGQIKHPMIYTIQRPSMEDDKNRELGRFHNEEVAKHKTEQSETTRKLRKIQIQAATTGAPVNHLIRNPDRVLTGLTREQEIRERIALKQLAKK